MNYDEIVPSLSSKTLARGLVALESTIANSSRLIEAYQEVNPSIPKGFTDALRKIARNGGDFTEPWRNFAESQFVTALMIVAKKGTHAEQKRAFYNVHKILFED